MSDAIVVGLITGGTAVLSASIATGLNILRESLQVRREDHRERRRLWREKGFDLFVAFRRSVGDVQEAPTGADLRPLRKAVSDQLGPIRMIGSSDVRETALKLAIAVEQPGDLNHGAINQARASFEDAVREDLVGA